MTHILILTRVARQANNMGVIGFLLASFSLGVLQTSADVVPQINTNGSYSISVNNVTWLQSAATFFRSGGKEYSLSDHSLKLLTTRTVSGSDFLCRYQAVCYDFSAGAANISACIRTCTDKPISVFQQTYTNGATASSSGDPDRLISGFPVFKQNQSRANIGFMSYGGNMFGHDVKYGSYSAGKDIQSGISGGPLVLFDQKENVLIISPFNQFMAASVYQNKNDNSVGWGIMGGVDTVPSGFNYETIMFYSSNGINQAMSEWGSVLRGFYKKEDSFRRSDLTLTHIGYWTDGGAYYYYNTEKGKDYEDTILDVWEYSKQVQLPYRFVQYDSFFYYKGDDGGVKTWTPMPDLFPTGFYGVYEKTGWPAGAHNRWWSPETSYAKQNGGQFDFIIEKKNGRAIPIEEAFWNYLFDSSREWGLTLYEQDWLDYEFKGLNATLTDIDLGRTWLMQMGRAALKNGITIQYCMSLPRHAMQSLEIPVVTQARVSGDYRAGEDNWEIGAQSLFADAMGIAPFKDNFWTSRVQPGNPKYPDLQEPHSELHAMVATLSTGPVAPGDKINATNVTMLMQCCNSDGLIMKPSKPATAIDAQIIQRALGTGGPEGELYTTYSRIGHDYFGLVLAVLNNTFVLDEQIAGFNFPARTVFSRLRNGVTVVQPFTPGITLDQECSKTSPCLYYTSPTYSIRGVRDLWIYGEIDKFVPMSPQRVTNIAADIDDVQVTVEGAVGEDLNFLFLTIGSQIMVPCTLGTSGTAVISFKSRSCRPF